MLTPQPRRLNVNDATNCGTGPVPTFGHDPVRRLFGNIGSICFGTVVTLVRKHRSRIFGYIGDAFRAHWLPWRRPRERATSGLSRPRRVPLPATRIGG